MVDSFYELDWVSLPRFITTVPSMEVIFFLVCIYAGSVDALLKLIFFIVSALASWLDLCVSSCVYNFFRFSFTKFLLCLVALA